MLIERGKDILCIRFSDVGDYDCIREHLEILNNIGYVWFGKIGNKPASSIIEKMQKEKSNYILLKDARNSYICTFDSFQHHEPKKEQFPNYYLSEILPSRLFSVWFRLTSISKINDIEILDSIVTKSSWSPFLETARKSMASHFYTTTKNDIIF